MQWRIARASARRSAAVRSWIAICNISRLERSLAAGLQDQSAIAAPRQAPPAASCGSRSEERKILTLPILPPFRAILDASELGKETWLDTAFGKPYAVAGFGNSFKDWCVAAGLPQCTSHGLRKIGAVRAAEAGASEHELMAMFGWEDADMARVYTRKAAQKRLAASGAAKLGYSEIIVPPAVPPVEIAFKNNALRSGWLPGPDSNQRPSG